MALPNKLKDLMLFNEGLAYRGEIESVTLPKLTRKLEAWRGGAMDGPVKIDMGASDDFDLEWQVGGPMRDVLAQFGVMNVAGVQLRFRGAYQDDSTGTVTSVEIDLGEAKVGAESPMKVKTALVFYQLNWNGEEVIYSDRLNNVLRIDGVDRLAGISAALGI
jgi:uncharacterized protein